MASKNIDFTVRSVDLASDKLDALFADWASATGLEYKVDQEDQRDLAEEAANRALLHEEEEEEPINGFPYKVGLVELSDGEKAIRVADDDAELEFYIEPTTWPALRKMVDDVFEEFTGEKDLDEAFDAVQAELDKAEARCGHSKYADGYCATMVCANYFGKLQPAAPLECPEGRTDYH